MTTTTAFYVKPQQITSVRLASPTNVSGTYFNGPYNNGIGATLTISASSLTIDGVSCNQGDRIMLPNQTTAFQNGVYDVTTISASVLLTRSKDFASLKQIVPGYYIPVSEGDTNAGNIFVLQGPAITAVGTSSIVLNRTTGGALIQTFDVTVGQAALASGGSVVLVASSGNIQYKVRNLWLNSGGTNFSGGGGDRLGQVTDGTTVYSVIPATNMQTLLNAGWGISTPLPFPASAAINKSTAAGANLVFKYSGGTTDYTAGSLVMTGMVELVA